MNAPLNPGDQLDHYRLEDLVARNGSTSTFRAVDLKNGQTVAIKVADAGMEMDPVFSDRFRREEEIARSLDHPGVLKFLGEGDRSELYLVTEWFDGQSLREILLKEKKLSPERAIGIALRICDALSYVHGHGIVHRDLKPENILVNAEDQIKLINFGTAAKAGSRRITFANLAQVVGTSKYVAPEELNGKRGDARSDIYSLGVILYEALTGRLPFQEANSFDRRLKNLIPPREIEPVISPQLQEAIYRALEPEHKNRYATAHEFALDLAHPERVGLSRRLEMEAVDRNLSLTGRKILFYAALALIPILILGLLLLFAKH